MRMKKILFVLMFTSIVGIAQDIKINPDEVTPLVVQVDSVKATEIYKRVKNHINKTYNSPDKVIIADENGVLIRVRSFVDNSFTGSFGVKRFWYTYTIEFKDNKYRISFTDLNIPGTAISSIGSFFNSKNELRHYDYYKDPHAKYTALINRINDEIKKAVSNTVKNDW
jgi:hypothetical protein